ncbi:MAG: glycogen debranching protein [bacterium]|nr:glycogen debranching protein [bacterium]
MGLIELAEQKAIEVLERNLTPIGLKAAVERYPHIWARDSMITFLGATAAEPAKFQKPFRLTLETLANHRSELGQIPNLVDIASNQENFGDAGTIDSTLWFIIGLNRYYEIYQDRTLISKIFPVLEQALLWLQYQDVNCCGLLESGEASDWADLFANRGNVLYVNVLYYRSLMVAAELMKVLKKKPNKNYRKLADEVKYKLNLLFWIDRSVDRFEEVKKLSCQRFYVYEKLATELFRRPYYLPYISFREYADRCDTLGNCLAILFNIADKEQAVQILDYFSQVGVNLPYPVKAVYPSVVPGSQDWREYYRNNNLNLPNQYHNGGIWPFIGGFYIAALVKAGRKEQAATQLAKLAELNKKGIRSEWEFTEWAHGITGEPMGARWQAWSAGMYLYAFHHVKSG